jgi:Fic family protein
MGNVMDWSKFDFDFRIEYDQALFHHIVSIEAYKEAALNLVLPPEWRDQLDRLNRIRAVYDTTALEGNPLSEAEVSHQIDLLEQPSLQSQKGTKEQMQIRNAGRAQAWVRQRFHPGASPLTLGDIFEMHRMVTTDSDIINNMPGNLRLFGVQVGSLEMGGVHRGAPHEDLPKLMQAYIDFIHSKRFRAQHPVLRALLAHFFLVTIHPFGDGNDRVSRLVEASILFDGGYNVHGFYGLSNYFYRHEQEYKSRLQECHQQQPFNLQPFIIFGIIGFASELKGINNFIKTKLNRIVYRTMLVRAYNKRIGDRRRLLNQREYQFLDFLLSETEPNDPFAEHPSKSISLTELLESRFIKTAYRSVTPRTFHRELLRLGQLKFIDVNRNEAVKDWIIEVNFAAIGHY